MNRLPTLKKIDQSKQPEVEITTLENGVRVVSTETADIIASLGVILDFGSSYEKPKEYGCTQLLQKLLFKASKQHSTEMIANSFSELGDPFSSYVSKESCSFIFNTYPDHIQDVLALYKECLESPYFDQQLIEECGNIIELENQTFYLSNTFDTFIEDVFLNVSQWDSVDHSCGHIRDPLCQWPQVETRSYQIAFDCSSDVI